MEGCSKNSEVCPKLLDFIRKEREWLVQKRDEERSHWSSEEKKLELRLGPPGEDSSIKNSREREDQSLLSLGYFSSKNNNNNGNQTHSFSSPEKHQGGSVLSSTWSHQHNQHHYSTTKSPSFLQFSSTGTGLPQGMAVMAKESSQPCCTKMLDLQSAEKKAFSPPPANTAVPNSSQKRGAPGPVVGWPPIRSFRKNLGSTSSSKPATESPNFVPNKAACEKPIESNSKGLFVKINMDGVPIGRKVDLKANDSYEKLSTAVDELFRGLLAAQRNPSAGGIMNKQEEEKAIISVLDGSGEYTLVYEDNEGDRMLVGDVPWHMFVSTVKRLRVLKSSDLSVLSLGSRKQNKIPI